MQRPTPTAWLGLAIIAMAAFVFVFAPWLAPHGLEEIVGAPFAAGSPGLPLGLDQNGRDMLSRLLYGAQLSIGVSLAAVLRFPSASRWAFSPPSAVAGPM